MSGKKINVELDLTGTLAYTTQTDPSGGAGHIVQGIAISPEEAEQDPKEPKSDFKLEFSLKTSRGMTASITNFRYYNNGSNAASQLGWWMPAGNKPDGISAEPAVGTSARLPDSGSDPNDPATNPTNGVIQYKGAGAEFEWDKLTDNKLVINDKHDNTLVYYYVIEFAITEPAGVAGTYVHDPRIKNW